MKSEFCKDCTQQKKAENCAECYHQAMIQAQKEHNQAVRAIKARNAANGRLGAYKTNYLKAVEEREAASIARREKIIEVSRLWSMVEGSKRALCSIHPFFRRKKVRMALAELVMVRIDEH